MPAEQGHGPSRKAFTACVCALKNTAGDSADDYLTGASSVMWGVSVGSKNCVFPMTHKVKVLCIHSDDAFLEKPCVSDHTPMLKYFFAIWLSQVSYRTMCDYQICEAKIWEQLQVCRLLTVGVEKKWENFSFYLPISIFHLFLNQPSLLHPAIYLPFLTS